MSVKSAKRGKKKSSKTADGFSAGDRILFRPNAAGKPSRRGEYLRVVEAGVVEVKLDGDPFTVCVSSQQITSTTSSPIETERESQLMPTATKPTAKELRRSAKALGIEDWEEMSLKQLTKAVADAESAAGSKSSKSSKKASKKAVAVVEPDEDDTDEDTDEDEDEAPAPKKSSKKSKSAKAAKPAAKKAAAKKAAPVEDDEDEAELPENGNPFRSKSNMWYIAEELIKGGKRSSMVKRLKKKITLKPRNASDDYDEDAELDRRVLIVGQILRNQHGFEVEREGRGADATIVATQPE